MKSLATLTSLPNQKETTKEEVSCKLCLDKKYVQCDEHESEIYNHEWVMVNDVPTRKIVYYKKCKCEHERLFDNKLINAGMESILHKIKTIPYQTVYDWQKEYYKLALDFVSNERKGLIISGGTGSGKTLLLGKMLYNFLHKGKDIFYLDWHNDFKGLVIDRYNRVDEKILNKLINVEVLYIDDLFKVRNNDLTDLYKNKIEVETFRTIIDKRVNDKNKKTMISTELYESHIKQLDESLWGRLLELVEVRTQWVQMDLKEDRNIRELMFKGEFK